MIIQQAALFEFRRHDLMVRGVLGRGAEGIVGNFPPLGTRPVWWREVLTTRRLPLGQILAELLLQLTCVSLESREMYRFLG